MAWGSLRGLGTAECDELEEELGAGAPCPLKWEYDDPVDPPEATEIWLSATDSIVSIDWALLRERGSL